MLRHVGFHKTGSTYLQEHFFPRLRVAVDSNEAYLGYPWEAYRDWRQRVSALSGRVLIVFRRQPEMLESLYKHAVLKGYSGSLASYIGLAKPRPGVHRMARGTDWRAFDYAPIIEGCISRLGRDNVLALPHEWMAEDLQGFCDCIADFAGTVRIPVIAAKPNAGASRARHAWLRLRNIAYERPVPAPIRPLRWGMVNLADVVTRKLSCGPARPMPREIRDKIVAHYREPNERLAMLLGADLDRYGY